MSQTRKVYLVRHGETVSNADGTIQGFSDPLSETGLVQAATIAERVKSIEFQHLLSSDMPRARVTAEHIAQATGKSVLEEPLLREIIPDHDMIGKKFSEFSDIWWVPPKTLDEHRRPWGTSAGAEIERAQQVLNKLKSLDSDALVVTHGAFLCIMLTAAMWESPTVDMLWAVYRKFMRSNTGITVLSYGDYDSDMWRLITWNDHAHLG